MRRLSDFTHHASSKLGSYLGMRPRQNMNELHRYAATENQKRYVLAELAGVGSYMISVGHLVEGTFSEERFVAACHAIIKRHEALRTFFELRDGKIEAVVEDTTRPTIHITDMSDPSFEQFRSWSLPLVFDDVDPKRSGALVRFLAADYGGCWRFTIAAHHAITDGFSRNVLNRELLKIYCGEELTTVSSYSDYVERDTSEAENDANFTPNDLPSPTKIFSDRRETRSDEMPGLFRERQFIGLSKSVKSLSKVTKSTRFNILSAVYALGLTGIAETDEISTFFQSEGRKICGAPNSVVGPFSNTLPLDLRFSPDDAFCDFAASLNRRTKAVLNLESTGLIADVIAAQKAPTVSINMFPPTRRFKSNGTIAGPREFLDRRTEYDLNLVWVEDNGELTARAFYNPARISVERVDLFLETQERLIGAALEDPTQSCREIKAAIRQLSPAILPRTEQSDPDFHRLHELVFQVAEQSPGAIAIETRSEKVSYGALVEESMRYCSALVSSGVDSKDTVAILGRKAPSLIASLLGVSASGATFVIIDSDNPGYRAQQLVELSGATRIINLATEISDEEFDSDRLIKPSDRYELSDICIGPPRAIAYHLFTSGTTGTPKLISHPEQTLQRFIAWQRQRLAIPHITTLMMAGISHDPIMRDIFLPLSTGGTIVMPTQEDMLQPCTLRDLIDANQVNVIHMTPSAGRLIALGDKQWLTSTVRAIFWGGERLTKTSVRNWRALAPHSTQFNLYGATETPQAATIHEITAKGMEVNIPIGVPVPWMGVRLLEGGEVVSRGEIGEITIDLSEEVGGTKSPHSDAANNGNCSHATGDLGYIAPDGTLRCLGRMDRQLNYRGQRLDPAEIEATVESLPGATAAHLVKFDIHGEDLCLFVADNNHGVSDAAVRNYLTHRLPSYMVPNAIQILDRIPLTNNGKVDEPALRTLFHADSELKSASTTPLRSKTELLIAETFKKFVGQDALNADQSLADIGADSLALIETRFALEDLGFELPQDWEMLPIGELQHCREQSLETETKGSRFLSFNQLDSFIVLRCIAILMIVTRHADVPMISGVSVLLFALTGFALGRVQLPAILNDERTGRVWSMVWKLLIPLIPISLAIYVVRYLGGDDPHIATLLLYENVAVFIDAAMLGIDTDKMHADWLWFLHVYVQIFVLVGLLLSIQSLLKWLRADQWRAACAFLIVTNALLAASMFIIWSLPINLTPEIIKAVSRSPIAILPFISIGILLAVARSRTHKTLAFISALMMWGVYAIAYRFHIEPLWLVGLFTCILIPRIKLPYFASILVATVSTQALLIYLSHPLILNQLNGAFGASLPVLLKIIITVAFGIVLGRICRPFFGVLGVNQLAQQRFLFRKTGTKFAARQN